MIIDYDHNPNITNEQRLQSLKESVQMALNDVESKEAATSKGIAEASKDIETINKDVKAINSELTVTTPSISISSSAGVLVGTNIRRFGNVVQLRLTVRNDASVASGGNVFVGTIDTTALRPIIGATGGSFYGAHAIAGVIGADGTITIRNASSTAVSITGTYTATVSFTYIVA